jgi:hypothetical protein
MTTNVDKEAALVQPWSGPGQYGQSLKEEKAEGCKENLTLAVEQCEEARPV